MQSRIGEENTTLYVLKAIAAYLVVLLHLLPLEGLGAYINVICRIAVPLFLMITGYFFGYHMNLLEDCKTYTMRQMKKILYLLVLGYIFYIPVTIYVWGG